jgi:hypothetical protein
MLNLPSNYRDCLRFANSDYEVVGDGSYSRSLALFSDD